MYGKPADPLFKAVGKTGILSSPGDFGDQDAVLLAANTRRRSLDKRRSVPEVAASPSSNTDSTIIQRADLMA